MKGKNEYLKKGQYAAVHSTAINLPSKVLTKKQWDGVINPAIKDVKKLVPVNLKAEIIIEFEGAIRVKSVIPFTKQGCLSSEENAKDLADQAIHDAMEKAREAAKQASTSLAFGDRLVQKMERSALSMEEVNKDLHDRKDSEAIRWIAKRSTGQERNIHSELGNHSLGGGHKIPIQFASQSTITIESCRLENYINKSLIEIIIPDAPAALRIQISGDDGRFPLSIQNCGHDLILLRFLQASGSSFSLDVIVSEQLHPQKRVLIPAELHNRKQIVSLLHKQLSCISEELNEQEEKCLV